MDLSVGKDSRVEDFTWGAYSRIRDLQNVTTTFSSAHSKLREELETSIPQGSLSHTFLPFVRERDSIGKLLKTEEESPERLYYPPIRSLSVQKRLLTTHSPKLKKPRPHCPIPPVGTYTVEKEWIKRSFCKRKQSSPMRAYTPQPVIRDRAVLIKAEPALVPKFQYVSKARKEKGITPDRFAVLRPEVAMERVKMTNFQCMKLADTPEELLGSFQFKERRQLKNEKLATVKRIMRRMLKGDFYN